MADVSFVHIKTCTTVCMHVCVHTYVHTYLCCVYTQEQVYTYTADTKYSPVTGDVKFGGFENFMSKIVLEFFFLRFVATFIHSHTAHTCIVHMYIQYSTRMYCTYIYAVHNLYCMYITAYILYVHDSLIQCVHVYIVHILYGLHIQNKE